MLLDRGWYRVERMQSWSTARVHPRRADAKARQTGTQVMNQTLEQAGTATLRKQATEENKDNQPYMGNKMGTGPETVCLSPLAWRS